MARSDSELLLAHLRGDRGAFAELVGRHSGVLWTVALRTLRDERDAAEAVQDALVQAHQHAADYRGEASVRSWLVRIVVNACRDRYRRAGRRPVEVRDEPALLRVPAPRDPIADHDLRMDLRDALGALPLEQRMVVVLVTMLGYPTEEVAEMLGIAVGTVKSRGARARAVLAEALADRAPRDRIPGSRAPVDLTPVDLTPVDLTPGDRTLGDRTSVDLAPTRRTAVDRTAVRRVAGDAR